MKNLCGKMRSIDNPYEVWQADDWFWHVLKKYQSPEKEAANSYARWFCAVVTPFTTHLGVWGDCYCVDIKRQAIRIKQFEKGELQWTMNCLKMWRIS